MAAIYKEDVVDIDLNTGNIHRSFLKHSIGTADSAANHFGIRVFRNGEPVNIEGSTVQGYFCDPRGNNIAITSGNIISGNKAVVVLPQACYNYEGQFCLAIKLVGNGVTGTMRIVDGMVDNSNSGGAVAPTGTVPTYQEVLAVYDQMVAAKSGSVRFDITQELNSTQMANARSNINAASEEDMNGMVPKTTTVNGHALSSNVTVTKGDVGLGNVDNTSDANKPVSMATQAALDLKVDKENIENDLTGTTAGYVLDARQGKVLDDKVSELKSALTQYEGSGLAVSNTFLWEQGSISTGDGTNVSSSTRIRTDRFIDLELSLTPYTVYFSASGYKLTLYFYESNGDYIDYQNTTGNYTIPATALSKTISKIKIVCYKSNEETIVPSEAPSVVVGAIPYNTKRLDDLEPSVQENTKNIAKIPSYTAVQGSWGNSSNQNIVLVGFFKPVTGEIKFHTDRPLSATGNYYKVGICEYNDSPYGNMRKEFSYKEDANVGYTEGYVYKLHSDTLAVAFQVAEYNSSDQQIALSASSFDNYHVWIEEYGAEELKIRSDYEIGEKIYCDIGNGTVPNAGNTYCVKTVNYIPCSEGDIVFLNPTRPVSESANKYRYGYSLYDSEKTEIERVNIEAGQSLYNYVSIPQNIKFVRFSIGETNPQNEFVTLRTALFVDNGYTIDAYVQSSKAFLQYLSQSISIDAGSELPDYWETYLNNKMLSIATEISDIGFYGESFFFLTDIHWKENCKNSPAILRYLKNNLPTELVVQGGDILDIHETRGNAINVLQKWVSASYGLSPVNIVGNHDDNSNGQTTATERFVGAGSFYQLMQSETNSFVNWVPGTNYGYTDYNVQKIRHIYLNTGTPDLADIDQTQLDWLGARVRELSSDWTVVVFGHMFFTPRTADYDSLVMNSNGWAVASILHTIEQEASHPQIACMISGHTHRDFADKPYDTFPVICTTCDTAGNLRTGSDPNSQYVKGTVTEQAFDIFCIDTQHKTIKTIRIGDGSDRTFTY
jgi:UDP-2,3-diacylglucosamine pyrophosphatase LpxH